MFLKRLYTKPPVVFPLVALFHLFWLGRSIYDFSSEPFPSAGWVPTLWMLCYTVAAIWMCDLKKMGGYIYMGLTLLNIVLRMVLSSKTQLALFTDVLFPLDIVFTFFFLGYYKRFE